jgi:hypothetical protein
MRGQIVVVKDVNESLLIRRVWDCSGKCVYIHSEEEWDKRIRGEKSLEPVGFPVEDVFQYDDKAKTELESPNPSLEGLTPFSSSATIAA